MMLEALDILWMLQELLDMLMIFFETPRSFAGIFVPMNAARSSRNTARIPR